MIFLLYGTAVVFGGDLGQDTIVYNTTPRQAGFGVQESVLKMIFHKLVG